MPRRVSYLRKIPTQINCTAVIAGLRAVVRPTSARWRSCCPARWFQPICRPRLPGPIKTKERHTANNISSGPATLVRLVTIPALASSTVVRLRPVPLSGESCRTPPRVPRSFVKHGHNRPTETALHDDRVVTTFSPASTPSRAVWLRPNQMIVLSLSTGLQNSGLISKYLGVRTR